MKQVLDNVRQLARFIKCRKELKKIVEALKSLDVKIVFTQGAYDWIHPGHAKYLAEAKARGDFLIVAIDDDELVRSRKGPGRPFDSEEERYTMVRYFRSVDLVVPKGVNEHPHDLLKLINPDVFVISRTTGDEIQKDVEEFKTMCGEVVNLPPQSSNTTTAKIRRMKIDSGSELKELINSAIDQYLAENDPEDAKHDIESVDPYLIGEEKK
jgi:rfaE bifunctional protein nucleotidyltransferase chain/domain